MGLLTNEEGAAFDEEYAQIQATRRAQLEAYNAARLAAGETPNPTQSDTDSVTVTDAQTGAEFRIELNELGGGGGADTNSTLAGVVERTPVSGGSTFLLTDANKLVSFVNTTEFAYVVVPADADVPFPLGTALFVRGTAHAFGKDVVVYSDAPVLLNGSVGGGVSGYGYEIPHESTAILTKVATNEWTFGYLNGKTSIIAELVSTKHQIAVTSGTITLDLDADGAGHNVHLTGDATVVISEPFSPMDASYFSRFVLRITVADNNVDVTWPAGFQWVDGRTPEFVAGRVYFVEGITNENGYGEGFATWYVTARQHSTTPVSNEPDDLYLSLGANLSDLVDIAGARTNLGLEIGTDVQAWSAELDTLAAGGAAVFNGVVQATPEDGYFQPELAHANQIIQLDNSADQPTLVIPNNSTPFPVGTTLLIRPTSPLAANTIAIQGGDSGDSPYVSINGDTGDWIYFPPGASGLFLKVDTNAWVVNFMPFTGVTRIAGLALTAEGISPSGTTFTFDTALYTRATIEPTDANSTFVITTPPDDAGDFKLMIYTSSVDGGAAFTPTWPENFHWAGGSAPTFAPGVTYMIEGSTFSEGSSQWYVKSTAY